jgi:hypothetical protein
MAWTRIVRSGKPRVREDPKYPGYMIAEMDLTTPPPPQWAQTFNVPLDAHSPDLSGWTIRIRYPDGQLADYVASVDARMEAANSSFERHVLPVLNRAEAHEQAQRETAQARVAREQREASRL